MTTGEGRIRNSASEARAATFTPDGNKDARDCRGGRFREFREGISPNDGNVPYYNEVFSKNPSTGSTNAGAGINDSVRLLESLKENPLLQLSTILIMSQQANE